MSERTNEIRESLVRFLRREIDLAEDAPIHTDVSLSQGGILDSFHLVQLFMFIEDEFELEIPEERYDSPDLQSIDQLAAHIAARSCPSPAS